ncbi:MAG: hypothetical protein U5K00_12210 [Melioribacteraceae bacterium]|nr:hypothetical protein [Melioribacteraceae bacterium]
MKRGFFILICIILFSNILFSQVNSITFGDIELHIGDAKGEVLYLLEQDFVCKKDTDIGNNNWESYEIIDLEENTLGDLYFDNDSLSLISKWNLLDSSDEVYNAFQTLFQLIYKQHISQFIGKGKITNYPKLYFSN